MTLCREAGVFLCAPDASTTWTLGAERRSSCGHQNWKGCAHAEVPLTGAGGGVAPRVHQEKKDDEGYMDEKPQKGCPGILSPSLSQPAPSWPCHLQPKSLGQ